jgi:DNA processing protein
MTVQARSPSSGAVDWLRLARTASVGPATFHYLIARFGAPAEALEALPSLARRGGHMDPPRPPSREDAEAELQAGWALGARLAITRDGDFPALLAALDPPPPLVWVLGDDALLRRPAVAIVGAREASAGGLRLARDLAAGIGAAGYAIVSGLARGIDAAAHQGSLASGAIAVLAGGVDRAWPPQNQALYDQVRTQGCIVSERPPGFEARAADFPRRNRLIAGLALGVVVVEAELKSGSLITARLAAEQGRDVFAVPGSPLDPRARGCNALLRQGAGLVEDAEDVISALNLMNPMARPPSVPAPPESHDGLDTGDLALRLAGFLSPAPSRIDDLARACGAPAGLVAAALTELALSGRAEILPGGAAVGLSA